MMEELGAKFIINSDRGIFPNQAFFDSALLEILIDQRLFETLGVI